MTLIFFKCMVMWQVCKSTLSIKFSFIFPQILFSSLQISRGIHIKFCLISPQKHIIFPVGTQQNSIDSTLIQGLDIESTLNSHCLNIEGTHYKYLIKALLVSTHNICFYGEIKKNIDIFLVE